MASALLRRCAGQVNRVDLPKLPLLPKVALLPPLWLMSHVPHSARAIHVGILFELRLRPSPSSEHRAVTLCLLSRIVGLHLLGDVEPVAELPAVPALLMSQAPASLPPALRYVVLPRLVPSLLRV